MAKSHWFRRLEQDLYKMDKQLRLVPVGLGFHRIYFKRAYVHEVFEEMPQVGYDIETYDPRLESQSYFEEFEDHPEMVRKIKNYVEGYWDSLRRIQRRVYRMRHNRQFYDQTVNAYSQMTIK